jgi:hypothetical protein
VDDSVAAARLFVRLWGPAITGFYSAVWRYSGLRGGSGVGCIGRHNCRLVDAKADPMEMARKNEEVLRWL